MRIGILETGDPPSELEPKYGTYVDMFTRYLRRYDPRFVCTGYSVYQGEFPASVDEQEGWLITGSKYSVYEDKPWITELVEFVQNVVSHEIPLAGICFGHQLIAKALGGKVERSEKGWGLGVDTYRIAGDSALWGASGGDPTPRNARFNILHQDQVVQLPSGAEVYASSDFCQYAGLLVGDNVLTIQAHPEFTLAFNRDCLECRKGSKIPLEIAEQAIAELSAMESCDSEAGLESQRFGTWLAAFFVRGRSA